MMKPLAAVVIVSWLALAAVMAAGKGHAKGAYVLTPPMVSIALALVVLAS